MVSAYPASRQQRRADIRSPAQQALHRLQPGCARRPQRAPSGPDVDHHGRARRERGPEQRHAPACCADACCAPTPRGRRSSGCLDGLLTIGDDGRITSVAPAPDDCALPESYPGAVILPGFVDATSARRRGDRQRQRAAAALARALGVPEELRFQSVRYAAVVAWEFCEALVRHGTTCAAIYGSSHEAATDVLSRSWTAAGCGRWSA